MARGGLVAALAPAVLTAGLFATPATGAQTAEGGRVTVEAPRQVTFGPNPTRAFAIPALAVDRDDPNTVVMAVGDARNGGCGLRVSHDGGLSWATTAENLLPGPGDQCLQRALAPVMRPVFGSDGVLHVAMGHSTPATDVANGPISLVVANTPDLGLTHELVTVAKGENTPFNPADYGATGPPQEGNSWNKYMGFDVDPNDPNRLYVMWRWLVWGKDLRQLQGDFVVRPYFSTSGDGGKTWTRPVDLITVGNGEKPFGSGTASLKVGPDGTVYGFARESTKPVPTGQTAPIARQLMFKSTDKGGTWEISALDEAVARMGNPEAAVDPDSGVLYVAHEQRGAATPSTSPPNPSDIILRSSTDRGKTWSKPKTISDDDPAKRTNQYYPGISVAPNGRVDVAWHDFRNDPFYYPGQEGNMGTVVNERYWDVYYTYSEDGGATWAPNERITNPSIDGRHGTTFNNIDTRGPMGIASSDKAAFVAWADSRATVDQNEAEDAYFARVRFADAGQLGAAGSSSAGSRLAWALAGLGAGLGVSGMLFFLLARRSPEAAVRRETAPAGGRRAR